MTQLILSTTPVASFIDDESNASFWYDAMAYFASDGYKVRRAIQGAIERADYYRLTYESAERSTHTDEEIITWIIGGNYEG